eukprot:3447005-Pyramimonas_sp.AAC.1
MSCARVLGACSAAGAAPPEELDPKRFAAPALARRSWASASAPIHGRELKTSSGTSATIWLLSVGRTGASAGHSAL